jgi:hypothetical protein
MVDYGQKWLTMVKNGYNSQKSKKQKAEKKQQKMETKCPKRRC